MNPPRDEIRERFFGDDWLVICVMVDGEVGRAVFGAGVTAEAFAAQLRDRPDVLGAHVIQPPNRRTP